MYNWVYILYNCAVFVTLQRTRTQLCIKFGNVNALRVDGDIIILIGIFQAPDRSFVQRGTSPELHICSLSLKSVPNVLEGMLWVRYISSLTNQLLMQVPQRQLIQLLHRVRFF